MVKSLLFWMLCLPGCFYDSRWGQQKASQRHLAAHEMPSQALARGPASSDLAEPLQVRQIRLRVFGTSRYTASTLDWERAFGRVVDDANLTLRADFGVELIVVDYRPWAKPKSDDSLDQLLSELSAEEPGVDVDWVLGLATAIPKLADSPDQLGVAPLTGKHMMLRAMSDAAEFDAIERGFTELSGADRQKLYLARKRHKSAAVLLHEFAHTLGVPHELAENSLMNPRYSHLSSGFSDSAQRIARSSLAYRAAPATPASTRDWVDSLVHSINAAPPQNWEPSSRDALLATLQNIAASAEPKPAAVINAKTLATPNANAPAMATATASTAAPATVVTDADLADLSVVDRAVFRGSEARRQAQDPTGAWRSASPLFARYPKVYAVQNLRCELAMAAKGSWDAAREECAGLMQITMPNWAPVN